MSLKISAVVLAFIIVFFGMPLINKPVHKSFLGAILNDGKNNVENIENDALITKNEPVVLIATGDVIPARSVNTQSIKYKDFTWAFKNVAETLRAGDITLINLESPLLKSCPPTDEGFKFCGSFEHINGLKISGVDVASLANNHTTNYGIEGLRETEELLRNNDILYTGTGDIAYKTVNNQKFAFLSFDDTGNFLQIMKAEETLIKKQIEEALKSAENIVVSFHWGEEYVTEPTQRQKQLAYFSIDNGADLIIGNHPHQIQPGEWYKDKYIKYAHGNFVFDQMWSEETKKGVIGKYEFTDGRITGVDFIPVYIRDYGQPILAE